MLVWLQTNGWTISLVGVIVNLLWNLHNQRRTSRLRSSTVQLEEFRSRVRTPIEAALTEISDARNNLRSLSSSGKALADLRTEVEAEWKEIVKSYQKLGDALEEADRSKFTTGKDWARLTDTEWDRSASLIDKVLSPARNEDDVRQAAREATEALGAVIKVTRDRIDQEVARTEDF